MERLAYLHQCSMFNLADAFACQPNFETGLMQRAWWLAIQAKSHLHDLGLNVIKRLKDLRNLREVIGLLDISIHSFARGVGLIARWTL